MGTRLNRLIEAVLTCTHNQLFEQKLEKNIIFFSSEIILFTSVKYCSILHGRVFVMCLLISDDPYLTPSTDLVRPEAVGKSDSPYHSAEQIEETSY